MIRIGNKIIKKSLEAGSYRGMITDIKEGEVIELKGGIKKDTVSIGFVLEVGEGLKITKNKEYIVTDVKGSELRELIDSLLPDTDIDKDGIDLNDLLGIRCEVEIKIDYSKRRNRYENIGKVSLIKKKTVEIADKKEAI